MQTQQRDIEEMLAEEGWRVAERLIDLEWWLDEVWVIESAWTPVGSRAFVSFLVDPQAPFERAKGEAVWAVCVTDDAPASNVWGDDAVPLRPHWNRRRDEVRQRIRRLRQRTGYTPR